APRSHQGGHRAPRPLRVAAAGPLQPGPHGSDALASRPGRVSSYGLRKRAHADRLPMRAESHGIGLALPGGPMRLQIRRTSIVFIVTLAAGLAFPLVAALHADFVATDPGVRGGPPGAGGPLPGVSR